MNTQTHICPRDNYPLVPVYSVEDRTRRMIALACPEPYCDHTQLVPKSRLSELEQFFRHNPKPTKLIEHVPAASHQVQEG